MTIPRTSTSRTSSFAALLALACALVIAAAQTQATAATENAVLRPLADESPSLPVTTTFEKSADADSGPYVLKVLSVAKDTLVVNAKIVASVVSHGDTKERNLPAHTLEVGQTWSITGLAATDKVTLTAKGYA